MYIHNLPLRKEILNQVINKFQIQWFCICFTCDDQVLHRIIPGLRILIHLLRRTHSVIFCVHTSQMLPIVDSIRAWIHDRKIRIHCRVIQLQLALISHSQPTGLQSRRDIRFRFRPHIDPSTLVTGVLFGYELVRNSSDSHSLYSCASGAI